MRPWLLIVSFAFSIGAAMAEDLPPAVQKAIAENKRVCKTVAIEKGFITRKDINGDGRPDFVLDYELFICDGNPRAFCGSIGCLTQVFASLPNGAYAKVFDDNVRRIDFREVQGRPAIVVGLPGFACGKDPTEVCDVVKSWNGSSFVEMPAPGTSSTAGIKNAKSLGPSNLYCGIVKDYGDAIQIMDGKFNPWLDDNELPQDPKGLVVPLMTGAKQGLGRCMCAEGLVKAFQRAGKRAYEFTEIRGLRPC